MNGSVLRHRSSPARNKMKQSIYKGAVTVIEADNAPVTKQLIYDDPEPDSLCEKITQRKIGSCTYIVTRKFKTDAKETLLDKLIRLIKNDNH